MDGDIETCLDDSSDQCEEMNFDMVSRYYQILMQQAENASEGGEKINCFCNRMNYCGIFLERQQNSEFGQMLWSQFLITLSTILQAQSASAELNQPTGKFNRVKMIFD